MPRIDEQECPGVPDAEPSDVAKLDRLKKKPSLTSIASNIPSPSPTYKPLQYELTKPLPRVPNTCETSIDYFRLLITARHSRMIATHTNLNALKHRMTKSLEKRSRSRLWRDVNGPEIDVFMGILLAMGCMKLDRTESYWTSKTDVGKNPEIPRVNLYLLLVFRCKN
jgi:hypothetical protein